MSGSRHRWTDGWTVRWTCTCVDGRKEGREGRKDI